MTSLVLAFNTRSFIPCRLRQQVTLELREGGHLATVQGNASTVRFDGSLPEGAGGFAGLTAAWRWRNWCGGPDVSVRYAGLRGYDLPASPGRRRRQGRAWSGRVKWKTVPPEEPGSCQMRPPWRSRMRWHRARPMPVPG